MFVKKWPKALPTGQFTNLKITQKCSYCKTVVELDDLSDLVFDGHASFEYGGLGSVAIYEWSYVCPCRKTQLLHRDNSQLHPTNNEKR